MANPQTVGETEIDPDAPPAPGAAEAATALADVNEDVSPDAPRPPTNDDIVALMDEAAAKAAAAKTVSSGADLKSRSLWDIVSLSLLWAGIFIALAAIGVVVFSAQRAGATGLLLGIGVVIVIALLFAGSALRLFTPALLSGVLMRRATGKAAPDAATLAGGDILNALGLAEKILDTDQDARLVSRRDGAVVYANSAYLDLAEAGGVAGPAGLPPRIDRLFAQHGAEATKIFRLCRAAKSGAPAQESIYQVFGLDGSGRRRRFDVSCAPLGGGSEYVSWLLRESPVEEDEQDVLAAAYADFPEGVFALEKSGQVAWANAALRGVTGSARGEIHRIDDIVLGETGALVRDLWKIDQSDCRATVRRAEAEPTEARLIGFRRGGVGEGFVCVRLAVDASEPQRDEPSLSGDVSEAPFGAALIEGDFGRDSKLAQANKAFLNAFAGAKIGAALPRFMDAETLEELASEVKRKAKSPQTILPVETVIGARTFALYARPERRRRGAYGGRRTFLYSVEVTEQKRMETEFAQGQKLKGIGQLASKVAHDFNNFLQAILGNCDRLMLKHPAGDPAYQELVQIRENAQRAANVTKQLLAFSRKQTLKREVQSITELLRDFSRFLDRNIGEKVSLELINGRGLPPVKVDRFQLETAIMNLAVNARDAMGQKGGKLTITTKLIEEAAIAELGIPELGEQDHVLVEVADTGPGVPEEIIDKVFDPFFTTKDIGKGTGLGLSTVYGIIGQMGGAITLESAKDRGAIFKIYLPAHAGDIDELSAPAPAEAPTGPVDLTGAGRILVVEDEDSVRKFVVATLVDCGYEVDAAEDGEEALEMIEETQTPFDLVITDVMMPVMDGPTFVSKARAEQGLGARVVFMSGYAEEAMRDELDMVEDAGYLQKPFTLKDIAAKVKSELTPADPGAVAEKA